MRWFHASATHVFEKAYGTNALEHLKTALMSDQLEAKELEQLQLRKLRVLLRTAWERSRFYHDRMRQAGVRPDEIKNLGDLQKIPTVRKSDLRLALEQGRLLTQPKSKLVKEQTGGSTGTPFVYYHTKHDLGYSMACLMRAWQWSGWRLGDSRITLWGRHLNLPLIWKVKALKDRLIGLTFLEADRLSDANAARYLRVIDHVKPAILDGYVSSLVELSRIGRARGIDVQSPGAVYTTSETLLPHERILLSNYFRTEVFDQYGSSEVLSLAFECPTHSGLHVAADHVVLEVGEEDQVVVTDLDNYAMPIIRYENGDAAQLEKEQCKCGRASPLLRQVMGRRSELVRGTNGNRVYGEFFTHILSDYGWIERYAVRQFQVVQERIDLIRLRMVVDRKPMLEDEQVLQGIIRKFLGNLQVQFEYPRAIQKNPAGKRQAVISHLR